MIFVTVGAQMPFERLCRHVDTWAGRSGRESVFAQIGTTSWRPAHVAWTPYLDTIEYRKKLSEARVVVTHAGIGTILSALDVGTPVIVLPRRGDLLETRNDHQTDTARAFAADGRVSVAWNEAELIQALDAIDALSAPAPIPPHASMRLLNTVRQFIHADAAPADAADPTPMIDHPCKAARRAA